MNDTDTRDITLPPLSHKEAILLLVAMRNEITRRLDETSILDVEFGDALADIENYALLMRRAHAAREAALAN